MTQNARMPITPSVVTWARVRAGFSIEEIEKKFKKISDWEAGTSSPTYPQLEELAEKFKVPTAVFFFPTPPDVPRIEETFRTLSQEDLGNIPPNIRLLLRKARSMQISLSEINDGVNPAKKVVTKDLDFSAVSSVEEMSINLRRYFNIPIETQLSWQSPKVALDNWRKTLFDHGIFVFKDAFRDSNFCGFCLYDEEFPVIYLNNSVSKTRQIFTVFHEIAHLLFRTSGVDLMDDEYINHLSDANKNIEVTCNHFSGCFLVPNDVFDQQIATLQASRESAESLSNLFCVSREVIYRKFLDRGRISQEEYGRAAREWRSQVKNKGAGTGNYFNTQMSYLGDSYIGMVLKKYHQNRFDINQLAEYMNMKPKFVSEIEERYIRKVK
ncbi:XRE family transcriptional regulator [Hahella sp. CR1]|uniref:helix-turn-helix domain-containing protein n=1 Tax=Hahella sp. CR1 TaxID=2992807 RepID=UPI00244370D9|nr:XRE family transcriptional regulator [Hahella sp. CR1]MDG9669418.1 XRE family transcriptional regulator [Hahella sp. CR1]